MTVESARLPEPLGSSALLLGAVDLGGVVLGVALGAAAGDPRSSLLALAIVASFAYASGRYRRSFAAEPRDEIFATLVPALEAAALFLLVVPMFAASWWVAYATLALWSIVASLGASAVTAARRGTVRQRSGTCAYLDLPTRTRALDPGRSALVAAIDRVVAAGALLLLAPLLVACAIAVFVESGSPVLFRQQRVGVRDRPFAMYKLRTMRTDADASWARDGDARVTRVGAWLRRTSLDELPQLWNVLRGEMSLVGPRPEMREYAERFAREIGAYEQRHLVPPGISGWAQLHYERTYRPEQIADVLPYDLFFVAQRSVTLHLYCAIKTVFDVLGHRAV
ncbi:MAG: sugar transferase [bacterium]|nr:sugar transferase [bacterium]